MLAAMERITERKRPRQAQRYNVLLMNSGLPEWKERMASFVEVS